MYAPSAHNHHILRIVRWRRHHMRLDVDGAGSTEPDEEYLVSLWLDGVLQASL
jgi:hypothetical protein